MSSATMQRRARAAAGAGAVVEGPAAAAAAATIDDDAASVDCPILSREGTGRLCLPWERVSTSVDELDASVSLHQAGALPRELAAHAVVGGGPMMARSVTGHVAAYAKDGTVAAALLARECVDITTCCCRSLACRAEAEARAVSCCVRAAIAAIKEKAAQRRPDSGGPRRAGSGSL